MRDHHDADRRSLALHAEVARRVRTNPELRERARARLSRISPAYREAWSTLLDGSLDRLLETLIDESETATALRQASPFSFAIDPKTRQRILRETVAR
ncbi:MAG TPA: MmcQ/YjbR family DNA-binding protein [Labilithrix sp.]|nr:MmcQ/YjbR family DNA-binding protein [Labilithrix sp.]